MKLTYVQSCQENKANTGEILQQTPSVHTPQTTDNTIHTSQNMVNLGYKYYYFLSQLWIAIEFEEKVISFIFIASLQFLSQRKNIYFLYQIH